MKQSKLAALRIIALMFLLPGLAGLVGSAVVSTDYLQTMPRFPDLENQRMVPRNIHGVIVYQTDAEDRRLDVMEYSSVSVFVVGLLLGVVYLEKWSALKTAELENGEDMEGAEAL
jgi:hypothetical protein